MTRDQIQATLRKEYDQQSWLRVLRGILPGTDVFAVPQTVAVPTPNVDVGGVTFKDSAANYSLAYLLALLNSAVLRWYFPHVAAPFRGGFRSANKQYLSLVPFPQLDFNEPTERSQHDCVTRVAELVVWFHARKAARENLKETTDSPLMAAFFEQWVNALVYELFFPQELHAAGLYLFDLILAVNLPPLETLGEPERLPRLQAIFTTTYASDHKLRQALYRLGSLDLVRTIEGKT
ncbi:MAG TPA: hypothetical protein VG146_14435 [Verrucomicrobiae bacterium]|nr:hypothetical protein [Verrucomicrobiae bacterium]